ncbi:MAG: hypothetical protein B5M55_04160 [Desulfococcus sp. 4484_242]|nr:MAG: hypothetical protein B5M55_04160 [Desulfococcus sp. 4484_242]
MSSKKRRKRNKSRQGGRPEATSANPTASDVKERSAGHVPQPDPLPGAREIRLLISKGDTKTALNKAKRIHKTAATDVSKAVLMEAYAARILSLRRKGMDSEADVLVDLVASRYQPSDQWLTEVQISAEAEDGIGDAFLAPLADPATPPETAEIICRQIKRKVVDLNVLADASTLPSDHPLRLQAACLLKAFHAVVSGPVRGSDISLPEVPRRSPLAPWKMLIQAISSFYQGAHEVCRRRLQAIDPDSAPARLVPVIRAMISGKGEARLSEKGRRLMEQVLGNRGEIRQKLQDVETALSKGRQADILPAVRAALIACNRHCPELVDRLKQHLSIRSWILDMDQKAVKKAMGGPSLKDAYYWRLLARAAELKGQVFLACAMWNEFMKHAVHEGLLGKDSPEASVIYLRMADMLAQTADEEFTWNRSRFEAKFRRWGGFRDYYKDQPKRIVDAVRQAPASYERLDFLYPERLYEMVCRVAPSADAFLRWLHWLQKQRADQKACDAAALAWRAALPQDVRPLLCLAKSAQRRSAYKKCLSYLDLAERIDGLNPDIKRIRLIATAGIALRHLREQKAHLVRKDINIMQTLPLFREGDRQAFVAALRWGYGLIKKDNQELREAEKELVRILGSPFAASLMVQALLSACGLASRNLKGTILSIRETPRDGDLLLALGRCCLLGDELGVPVSIPEACSDNLEEAFRTDGPALDEAKIMAVGNAALRQKKPKLAYSVSVAGLRKQGASCARFLLLRATALPLCEHARKKACMEAAIGLARKERDMDLLDEAVELQRNMGRSGLASPYIETPIGPGNLFIDDKTIDATLAKERAASDYPDRWPGPDDDSGGEYGDADFPDCRRCDAVDCADRIEPYDPDLDDWDDEDGGISDIDVIAALIEDGLIDIPPDIPPEIVPVMLKLFKKYGDRNGRIPPPDELLRKDPELAEELEAVISDALARGGFRDRGRGRSSSQKRKRGSRSKKQGRR